MVLCPCCDSTSFNFTKSEGLAQISHWKDEYSYSVVEDFRFNRVLRQISDVGIKELEDFYHFVLWQHDKYLRSSRFKKSTIKNSHKIVNQTRDWLINKIKERPRMGAKYHEENNSKIIAPHDLVYEKDTLYFRCNKCSQRRTSKKQFDILECRQ